jgi:flagellar export protein FliJ
MTGFIYRLQPLLEHKEDAKKEAECELLRREEELEKQRAHLQTLHRRLQELVEKRQQLQRDLMSNPYLGTTLTGREVQQRIEYINAMGLQIEEAQANVSTQRTVVEDWQHRVQQAKKDVQDANREVEILQKHRAKQEERFVREQEKREELALDEIGNVLYTTRRSSI